MIALAGCNGGESYSLAGEWDWMDGHTEFPRVCGSHGTVQYHVDGSYTLWGEAGMWRLDGNALTETMTDFDPLHVDRSPDDIGKAYVSTVKWVDKNTFVKRRADGSKLAFRRCPDQN